MKTVYISKQSFPADQHYFSFTQFNSELIRNKVVGCHTSCHYLVTEIPVVELVTSVENEIHR